MYTYLNITNDLLIFGIQYYYHPKDQKLNSGLVTYNITKDRFTNAQEINLNNMEWSLFAHDWVSSKNNMIAFSQSTDYKIKIYDTSLYLVDSIIYTPENWKVFNNNILQKYRDSVLGFNSKNVIYYLMPFKEKYSRIESVFFKDHETLIVVYFNFSGLINEESAKKYLDIWKLKNGRWVLDKKSISCEPVDVQQNDKITKTNFGYSGLHHQIFVNDLLIQITELPFDIKFGITRKEAEKRIKKEILNTTHKLNVFIYKTTF